MAFPKPVGGRGGSMRIIDGNVQIRHMKELRNRGATSNARFRIVHAFTRRKGR